MNRRFAANLMIATAGILLVPAAGVASADTQTGTGSVFCDEAGETQNENGMSCANSNINGVADNGPSIFGIDLADLASLIESITKG